MDRNPPYVPGMIPYKRVNCSNPIKLIRENSIISRSHSSVHDSYRIALSTPLHVDKRYNLSVLKVAQSSVTSANSGESILETEAVKFEGILSGPP